MWLLQPEALAPPLSALPLAVFLLTLGPREDEEEGEMFWVWHKLGEEGPVELRAMWLLQPEALAPPLSALPLAVFLLTLVPREDEEEGEMFWVRHKLGEEGTVQLRAANGNWVQALDDGRLIADIDEDAPRWDTTCTFTLSKLADMGGEAQLMLALGREEAERRLQQHREEWVGEGDFEWLARQGMNAVRIPVGWWVAVDPTPEEFVEGALELLDKVGVGSGCGGSSGLLCLHLRVRSGGLLWTPRQTISWQGLWSCLIWCVGVGSGFGGSIGVLAPCVGWWVAVVWTPHWKKSWQGLWRLELVNK
ncbi:unnamed protein product, partial [Closterium sp. NIES-54]